MLSKYILYRWQLTKAELQKETQSYWSFRDEIVVIDMIAVKGIIITIPTLVQKKDLDQLYVNHMGIEKTIILSQESVYWINIPTDIEKNH